MIYHFRDPYKKREYPNGYSFLYTSQSSSVLNYNTILFKLLIGGLEIKRDDSPRYFRQDKNFSTIPPQTISASRDYFSILLAKSPSELKNNFGYPSDNRQFYLNLVYEICEAFYHLESDNQLLAFLYLYRFLEAISFSFPMIYAARSNDFLGGYDLLKGLLEKGRRELVFFKKFQQKCLQSSSLGATCTIQITSLHGYEKKYYDALIKCIENTAISSSTKYSEINIPYSEITNVVINIRNRYFHQHLSRDQRFNYENIPLPEEFFSMLNPIFFSWLGYMYFEIAGF